MNNNENINLAEEVAKLIIDKSYWGDQWFLFFCLLVVGLISAFSAWAGAYLSTRAQNAAVRADFSKALKNLEEQTKVVKRIEEDISHNYLETREVARIKREKIELIYMELKSEAKLLGDNLRIVSTNTSESISLPSFTVEMLMALYFKDELEKELEFYLDQRNILITKIRELAEENLSVNRVVQADRFNRSLVYFTNYNQSKTNIELGLESLMKNLTSQASGTQQSCAPS